MSTALVAHGASKRARGNANLVLGARCDDRELRRTAIRVDVDELRHAADVVGDRDVRNVEHQRTWHLEPPRSKRRPRGLAAVE